MTVTCLVSRFPFQVTWPGLSGEYPPIPLSSVPPQGRTPPESYGETDLGSLLLQHGTGVGGRWKWGGGGGGREGGGRGREGGGRKKGGKEDGGRVMQRNKIPLIPAYSENTMCERDRETVRV